MRIEVFNLLIRQRNKSEDKLSKDMNLCRTALNNWKANTYCNYYTSIKVRNYIYNENKPIKGIYKHVYKCEQCHQLTNKVYKDNYFICLSCKNSMQ